MQRAGNLFDAVVTRDNLRLAFLGAIRGKRSKTSVLLFLRNIDYNSTESATVSSLPILDGGGTVLLSSPSQATDDHSACPAGRQDHAPCPDAGS
jgi:hypothetical protein